MPMPRSTPTTTAAAAAVNADDNDSNGQPLETMEIDEGRDGPSCLSPTNGGYFNFNMIICTDMTTTVTNVSVARRLSPPCHVAMYHPPAPSCTPHGMPNMKTHPRWCVFVFGMFSSLCNTQLARNHIYAGAFSCSVAFSSTNIKIKCILILFIY